MSNDKIKKDAQGLFQKEMAQVKPLKSDNKISHKTKAKTVTRKKPYEHEESRPELYDNFSDFAVEDCPEQLNFSRGGLQHSLLKKLRLGKIPIENHLDLHGNTVAEARQALLQFIAECEDLNCRCVIIVHGKGYSSPNKKPVIKAYVNRWLKESSPVLAFCSAQPGDGGTGAVYLLLKTS